MTAVVARRIGRQQSATSFCDRVQLLVDKYAEGNASDFARQTGIPRRTIQKVIEGNISNPGVNFAARLVERFPAEDARWLLTGKASSHDLIDRAGTAKAATILQQLVNEMKERKQA